MAAMADQGLATMGMQCTEEEPDDDFMSFAASRPAAPVHPTEGNATPEPEPTPQLPPLLEGDWHQLEGVPRPQGEGPRLLCWNSWGSVGSYPSPSRTDVAMHYSGEESSQRFQDYDAVEMASIARDACCVAIGANASGPSRLLIRPKTRWDKAVFSAPLGINENVEAVACGDGFAAALTSKQQLRVYSTSGLPLALLSVPGRSVALAARGPLLLVVTGTFPGGPPADAEDEALDYRLLQVNDRMEWSAGRLPLSPGARLRWVGLSEDFAPVAVDSCGIVRALLGTGTGSWGPNGGRSGEWMPVLSLAEEEGKLGPLWTVSAGKGELRVAEVGADAQEPVPRPGEDPSSTEEPEEVLFFGVGSKSNIRTVPWRLPIGAFTASSAGLEETLRSRILLNHQKDLPKDLVEPDMHLSGLKGWRQKAIHLFRGLLDANEEERALDVARLFLAESQKLLENGTKLAEFAGKHRLADAIAGLKPEVAVLPAASQPGRVTSVPKAVREELPSLFQPGDVDGEASPPVVISSSKSSDTRTASQASPAASPAASAAAVAAPPEASASSTPLPPVLSNPFVRKRPVAQRPAEQPHLLRDTLGGRRPATPATPGAAGPLDKKAKI